MISSQFRRTGYLLNDDRASGGALEEADIRTCPHCQKILKILKSQTEGDWCHRCGAPVCEACGLIQAFKGCTPFRKLIDEALDRQAKDRAYKQVLGL